MTDFNLATKILEKITEYHKTHSNNAAIANLKSVAAAEISHMVKEAYEESLKAIEGRVEESVESLVTKAIESESEKIETEGNLNV